MTATTDLLDVSIVVTNKLHGQTKKVSFLFHGNLKQVESYIFNLCQMYSLGFEYVISIYDLNAQKYLVGKK